MTELKIRTKDGLVELAPKLPEVQGEVVTLNYVPARQDWAKDLQRIEDIKTWMQRRDLRSVEVHISIGGKRPLALKANHLTPQQAADLEAEIVRVVSEAIAKL